MTTLRDPHDQFFKAVFSQPAMAADFLHHYLPPAVAAVLDLAGLRLAKASFVDPQLQPHYSDLLYHVPVRDGGEAYVHVLFEHKSYAERWVALDLLRYDVRIWEDDVKAKAKAKLPVIIPIVVYHGRGPWRLPTDFGALLAVPAALREYVPDFRYLVIDLSHRPDEALCGEVMLQVTLLLFKYIFRPDLRERLPGILGLLRELVRQRTGLEYLYTALRYLSQGTDQLRPADLSQVLAQTFPRGDELMPTLAEQWVEEGVQRGMQRGIQQGVQQEIQRGLANRRNLTRRLLNRRFGELPAWVEARLDSADETRLDRWTERLLEAATLAEVFQEPTTQ